MKWSRCPGCRKIQSTDQFDDGDGTCRECQQPTRATSSGAPRAATVTARKVAVVSGTPMTDLRGRGDPEVRSRRARQRALERLSERYPEEFGQYLDEERAAEKL